MTGRRGEAVGRRGGLEIRAAAGPFESAAMGVQGWPVHRLLAYATQPGGVSAAVAETGLMAHNTSPGTRRCLVGHCVGGWVIHLPAVACTSSPNTMRSLSVKLHLDSAGKRRVM